MLLESSNKFVTRFLSASPDNRIVYSRTLAFLLTLAKSSILFLVGTFLAGISKDCGSGEYARNDTGRL